MVPCQPHNMPAVTENVLMGVKTKHLPGGSGENSNLLKLVASPLCSRESRISLGGGGGEGEAAWPLFFWFVGRRHGLGAPRIRANALEHKHHRIFLKMLTFLLFCEMAIL